MSRKGKRLIEAVAYICGSSSATNIGADKDSREAATCRHPERLRGDGRFVIVDWFYDAAVRGSDPVYGAPRFAAMLDRIAGNGVRTVLVESPDRFARDLAVQLAGHDYLKRLGVELIPTSAPDFFTEDTPSAVLIRQVLGAVAEFPEDRPESSSSVPPANASARRPASVAVERHMPSATRNGTAPCLRRLRS